MVKESETLNSKLVKSVALKIRKDIKEMKDAMPWPPRPDDLTPDQFKVPDILNEFLNLVLAGTSDENCISTRLARLKFSFAQDIVYAVTGGRVKTPKSILLPSIIKTLTNNTEIVNIVNRLGHGVSYSILSELNTENAYAIQKEQTQDNLILPENVVKELFTIYVADNIDRNEETLSGTL